jgi:hypothetical protein
MLERMVYRAAPPAPGSMQPRTVMEQEFTVTVHGIPLASYLEDTILGSLARNAFKVDYYALRILCVISNSKLIAVHLILLHF